MVASAINFISKTHLYGRLWGSKYEVPFLHFELCYYQAIEYAIRNNIKIEHACEMSCACTTCHIIIREGFDLLKEATDEEEDLLDKAWGLEPDSRLSCQTIPEEGEFTVELPKYTINQVSEDH